MRYTTNSLLNGFGYCNAKLRRSIMQILSQFGSTEGIKFDHNETGWDFG